MSRENEEITGRSPALMILGAWTVLVGRRSILGPSFRATLLATTRRYGHDQHDKYDRYGNHNDDDTCTDSQRNEHASKTTADAQRGVAGGGPG